MPRVATYKTRRGSAKPSAPTTEKPRRDKILINYVIGYEMWVKSAGNPRQEHRQTSAYEAAATSTLSFFCVCFWSRFTHIGQIKGAYHGKKTVDGDPIVSISANDYGLHVRFSNKASIEDFYTEEDWYVTENAKPTLHVCFA